MGRAVWLGIGVACLTGLTLGTHANVGLGRTLAGRSWNGWIMKDSGELVPVSMRFQPNGKNALQSYADLVVTKDGETSQYRGWVYEGYGSDGPEFDYISFQIVGEREVVITNENREEEYKRDRKTREGKAPSILKMYYKGRTLDDDPATAVIGTCKGFLEGRVGLISFDPAAMGR